MATLAQRGFDADWLKSTFLLGVDLTLDDGSPYPSRVFDDSIVQASRALEDELGLVFEPQAIQERHDKEPDAAGGWYPIRTRHRPLLEVEKLSVVYGQSSTRAELPASWCTVTESIAGQIHIIPVAEGANSYIMHGGLPYWIGLGGFNAHYYLPAYFELEYLAGFPLYTGSQTIAAGELVASVPTPQTFRDKYIVNVSGGARVTLKRFDRFEVTLDQAQAQDVVVTWSIDTLPADII